MWSIVALDRRVSRPRRERPAPPPPHRPMTELPWIIVAIALLATVGLVSVLWRRAAAARPAAKGPVDLPDEWALQSRLVFTPEERAVFRQLRDALPHHTILAKLPLVRFCQPEDSQNLRYWYDLLGSIHVSFAVCSANGRVLAAVDIESTQRPPSRRVATIKRSVMDACRVRYVCCRSDQLPSVHNLQMLVPQQGNAARPTVPDTVTGQPEGRATLAHAVRARRAERPANWTDSTYSQDSFFVPDSRGAEFSATDAAELLSVPPPVDTLSPDIDLDRLAGGADARSGGGVRRPMRASGIVMREDAH